jgi:hypothetical protein
MILKLEREGEKIEVSKITIFLNEETEIRISVNQFGELVVNKSDSAINIIPQVSNEILIK